MMDQPKHVQRRLDLDWIRIAAFGSLILYHVGMVFVPWYYHVKSTHIVPGLEPLMLALNPWRLSLLFFVAGCATRFMSTSTATGALLRSRSGRLLLPLVFGIVVIVPPQSYWEVMSRHVYDGSFLNFYTEYYFAFKAQFCGSGQCLILPTWNHLWFVAYLWVYTTALMLVVALLPGIVRRAEAGLAVLLSGIGLIVLPALVFGAYRLILFPRFPQTNALVDDWYNHALYFSMFALGFLIACADPVWLAMTRWRWVALAIAATVFASYISFRIAWPSMTSMPAIAQIYQRSAYALYQWCCIVAVLGFGRHLITTQDSPARRYLTDAIFPFYIVHQTVIVGVAFALRDAGFSAPAEAAIITATTFASCMANYEIIRRVTWLRPLFGLKSRVPPRLP